MNNTDVAIDFTGEFFVPNKSGERIEADHMERYHFACKFAKNKSILDIACGVGYSAPLFIKAGAIIYEGVDLNEKLVKYANHTYGSDCVNFFIGDIYSYSNGKTYDMITCYETIEHVENYESALKNLYILLKPGGALFISSPNRLITSPRALSLHDKPVNAFHTQEFTPEELLLKLRDSGFIASRDDIYGQRHRRVYSNRFMRKIVRVVFGNPDKKTSPVVTPIRDKVPRYFIIVATKKDV
jgi:SAM-dependent methyltransferase